MMAERRTKKKMDRNTQKNVSELSYTVMKAIGDRLDMVSSDGTSYWRKLAELLEYDHMTVEKLGMASLKPDGSPGYSLLLDMSNRGSTYDELVSFLKRLNLFEALSHLGYKEDVKIIKHPRATPVMLGQRLELECRAEGVPRPSYQWYRGKVPLKEQCTAKLIIEKVSKNDTGLYTCRAGNNFNFVFSNWAEVMVQTPVPASNSLTPPVEQELPRILMHPEPELMLEVGQKLYLACQATGPGTLSYQWYRDGDLLPYGKKMELVVEEVQIVDQGAYTCCVSSSVGSSTLTNRAVVRVQARPPFPTSPVPMYPPMEFGIPVTQPIPQIDPNHNPFDPAMMLHLPAPGSLFMDGEIPVLPGPFSPQVSSDPPKLRRIPLTQDTPRPPSDETEVRGRPPPAHLTESSTSRQIIQHDPEAGGQDHLICEPDRQCSDKVALLIGNKNYHSTTLRLNTPENDVQDMAGILRCADFKVVTLVNLTKKEMDDALDYFTQLIGPNVYAVFFFAGHGFEFKNMNYMMAVDSSKEKNPAYCICAQYVLRRMQERGAKLSIVLLDMCRVVAPLAKLDDPSGIYEHPYPPQSYSGYHIYGFSCSPAEKAYELARGTFSNSNSIFVQAMKDHLQDGSGSLQSTVQNLLNSIAKVVHNIRPTNSEGGQWQRPEINSNLGEDLSLADAIDQSLQPEQRSTRSQNWEDAHTVPNPVVVGSNHGELALRLHFQAEHSNVLIVQVEVLQGCLTEVEVLNLQAELLLEERWVLSSALEERQSGDVPMEKSLRNKSLLFFKIPDLQKIKTPSVQLHLWGEYRWKDKMDDFAEPETRYDHVRYTLSPPPLYGKVCALYSPQHMPLSPFSGQHHPNSPFVGQHRPVSPFGPPSQHGSRSPFANEHGF